MAGSAAAQDIREIGKTPAQLFASDCAMCHKSPRGLSKAGGIFGLQGFLREHYTTSRETAGAIAAFLSAADREAPPREQRRATTRRTPKTDQKGDGQTSSPKSSPSAAKSADGKAAEAKPAAESKAAEPNSAELRPVTAPAESKSEGASAASAKRE